MKYQKESLPINFESVFDVNKVDNFKTPFRPIIWKNSFFKSVLFVMPYKVQKGDTNIFTGGIRGVQR